MADVQKGYVKIYRSITEWEWYRDSNTRDVFLHLLFTANYKPGKWRGHTIKKGQRAVSIDKISTELSMSVRSVRTAINHLKSTGELTSAKTPECTLFTITNYEKFQEATNETTNERQTTDKPPTNDRQAIDKRATSDRQLSKNSKKERIPPISPTGDCGRRFERFWDAYPRKAAKANALQRFAAIDPDEETLERMLAVIAKQKRTPEWTRENGRYVPYPSKWLGERRWEEAEQVAAPAVYPGYRRLTPDD